MSKFLIEAIRALPEPYVTDGTQVHEMDAKSGPFAVAISPYLIPIAYNSEKGWHSISGLE